MSFYRQSFKKYFPSNLASLFLGIFLVILVFTLAIQHTLGAQNGINQLKNELNKKLEEIQGKINAYSSQIKQREGEAKTLKREIDILEAKISQVQLEIEQTELVIKSLDFNIKGKEKEISKFDGQINIEKEKLAEYLQTIYEYDQISLSEILLQNQNFSEFLNEVQTLEDVQVKIIDSLQQLQGLKKGIEDQKNDLEEEKVQYSQMKMLQDLQRKSFQSQQDKKESLLKQTKGQESLYQKLIGKAHTDIASIKNQLYLLEGVGLSMTLEEALKHAEYASSKTGVRPAYLLAVLKVESSWGNNVGTGYWSSDMHTRDHKAFLEICLKLGFDPDKMPVSRKPSYGWGGAMGPAQFLPSTWLSYEAEIAQLTGHNPPNPWDTDDAFVAAGLKLAKNGANLGGYDAEWKAAMVYFAGSRWNNPVYRFYGDNVMDMAATLQEQVDAIKGQ